MWFKSITKLNLGPSPNLHLTAVLYIACGYMEDDGLTFVNMCSYWQHMSCMVGNPPLSKDNSTVTSDDDQNSSSASSSHSSSKAKFITPMTVTSTMLPEQWFCECCIPRPVDASTTHAWQTWWIQADHEWLLQAAGIIIIDQLPNRCKKSRSDNPDKCQCGTITDSQNAVESVQRLKSGPKLTSSSNCNHSTLVDISPLDEDTMFEPWANEFVHINPDIIMDEGVRQAICCWCSSLECMVTSQDPLTPTHSQAPPSIPPVTECLPLPPLPSKIASIHILIKQVPLTECQPTPVPVIASLPPPNATPSYLDNSFHSSDPKSLSYGCPLTYSI